MHPERETHSVGRGTEADRPGHHVRLGPKRRPGTKGLLLGDGHRPMGSSSLFGRGTGPPYGMPPWAPDGSTPRKPPQ